MLTADLGLLGVVAGDAVLDLGCGFGRHAYEAARRGASVVAVDRAEAEVGQTRATLQAMADAGEVPPGTALGAVRADALALPFASGTFDRVVAAEVFEHLLDDGAAMAELARVLRPGGTAAVTVPAFGPERICWALSDRYHAPAAEGGHVRIYREAALRRLLEGAGLRPGPSHRAHALHSPYWWLRCAIGPDRDDHLLVRPYRRLLEWDIVSAPAVTRRAERLLDPVLGKSLVVYATKPAGGSVRAA
jgi:SAM-dependent methyltransferase